MKLLRMIRINSSRCAINLGWCDAYNLYTAEVYSIWWRRPQVGKRFPSEHLEDYLFIGEGFYKPAHGGNVRWSSGLLGIRHLKTHVPGGERVL